MDENKDSMNGCLGILAIVVLVILIVGGHILLTESVAQ